MLINNKEKQAVGGNWGHPRPFIKSQTKVIPPPDVDKVKHKKAKRNKKEKKPYIYPGHCCPFCTKELPIDEVETKKAKQEHHYLIFGSIKMTKCECGAFEVQDCPACHRKTWYKDSVYKHNKTWGCGFEGQRKIVKCINYFWI